MRPLTTYQLLLSIDFLLSLLFMFFQSHGSVLDLIVDTLLDPVSSRSGSVYIALVSMVRCLTYLLCSSEYRVLRIFGASVVVVTQVVGMVVGLMVGWDRVETVVVVLSYCFGWALVFVGCRIIQTKSNHDPETTPERGFMKSPRAKIPFRWVLGLFRPDWFSYFVGTGSLIVAAICRTWTALIFGRIIDSFSKNEPLLRHFMALVVTIVVECTLNYIRAYVFTLNGHRMVKRLRTRIFKRVLYNDVPFFDTTQVGEIVSRLTSDCQVVQQAVTLTLVYFIRFNVQLISSLFILLHLSWFLALITFSSVPFVIMLSWLYGRFARTYQFRFQNHLADASVRAEESLSHIRSLHALNAREWALRTYSSKITESFRTGCIMASAYGGFTGVVGVVAQVNVLAVVWVGAREVRAGVVSTGTLATFLYTAHDIALSVSYLSNLYGDIMQTVGATERLYQLETSSMKSQEKKEEERQDDDCDGAVDGKCEMNVDDITGNVCLDNVTFAYDNHEEPCLRNLTLSLPENKVTLITGESGSGKSSICSLLARLYRPNFGRVYLNGINIDHIPESVFRNAVVYLPQTPAIFSTSIRENVVLGNYQATDDEIFRVCQHAGIQNVRSFLREGLDTQVSSKTLSGGQQQRIALARALLLRKPRVLVLDEALSAIDQGSEIDLLNRLRSSFPGICIVNVTHRPWLGPDINV